METKELIIYAGFWRRFFAALIDFTILLAILVSLLQFMPNINFYISSTPTSPIEYHTNIDSLLTLFILFLMDLLYNSAMESSARGASLGKMAFNVKVVNYELKRISFWQAAKRNLSKPLSALTIYIGYIMIVFNKNKQALHDKLSKCLVIQNVPELEAYKNKKKAEEATLKEQKTKAELASLQAKINPHFLYNCLNSIASLIKEEPDKAEKMVIGLSKFFRYSINTQNKNITTVREEIEIAKVYLEVEKIRFDDKLEYSINVAPETMELLIPRFLIQPLVENAIKHGTSKLISKGIIKIDIVLSGSYLYISVYDNGPDFPSDLISGHGLQSTYDTLNLLYKDAYEFQILNGTEKGIKITLKKPLKDERAL